MTRAGGVDGSRLEALLAPQHVDAVTVGTAGTIRTNTTVVERDGTTTELDDLVGRDVRVLADPETLVKDLQR
ncbi:hypothetical protein ACFQ46_21980 [Kineococcus sp. GCM10028916]|uniref:hypothetical protein n=1 Tax=Kineococcus sp. GCM10028916 TaxID=3273394 RepID=UPI003630A4C6